MYIAGPNLSGAPIALGAFGAARKSMSIQALQIALRLLGSRGDGILAAVTADGVIGPRTVAAANRALRLYVTRAPASLRTGKLTAAQVSAQASTIASLVAAEARKRGVSDASFTTLVAASSRIDRTQIPRGAKTAVPAKAPPTGKVVKNANIRALQAAVRGLGQRVHDAKLVIAADGFIGPKTVAATNRAMQVYVTAPAAYKTGALSRDQVFAIAATLTPYIVAETSKRGASAHATANHPAVPAPAKVSARKASVITLQKALASLGEATGDTVLNVVADGLIGPKTITATNRTFQHYIAGTAWSRGLTSAQVATNAAAMADAINREVVKRAGQQSDQDAADAAAAAAEGGGGGGAAASTPAEGGGSAATPSSPAAPATTTPGAAQELPPGDEGGGGEETSVTPGSGGGWWSNLSTGAKVAVGAGGAVTLTGIVWAIVHAVGSGGARHAPMSRRRYA